MNLIAALKRRTITMGLVYILLGVFFILRPDIALSTIGRLVSIVGLVYGLVKIIRYFADKSYESALGADLSTGLVLVILSGYFLLRPEILVTVIFIVLGFGIVINGITKLQSAIDLHRLAYSAWYVVLGFAIVNMLLGIIALLNPFDTAHALMLMIGISMAFGGLADIVIVAIIGRKTTDLRNGLRGE